LYKKAKKKIEIKRIRTKLKNNIWQIENMKKNKNKKSNNKGWSWNIINKKDRY
jgi:hypothetical protein